MNDPDLLLQVKDLSIAFPSLRGESTVVKRVDFELRRGEVLGIVGESGSGKSMTALSILQLLPGSALWKSGRVVFYPTQAEQWVLNDLSQLELQKVRGRRIGMVFQDPMSSLNPVYTCGDQVVEVLRWHQQLGKAEARQAVLQLFEQVRLQDPDRIFRSYPHQLSGGQKQRIMIAIAIAAKPDLIIADEPTTSLDVTVQRQILQLLLALKNELQISLLFISHDLGVIGEIADRVMVMRDGEIVESGPTKEVLQSPKAPYTKGLMACRPPLQRRLRRLPTINDYKEGQQIIPEIYPPAAYRQHLEQIARQEVLLQVKGLSTWYPGRKNFWGQTQDFVKAVDEVSFDLRRGESVGLVGESGCGKSTLGRSLLRLIEPKAGRVLYEGVDLVPLDEESLLPYRKRMQIVFQDPFAALNPRKMIGQAIVEPMRKHFPTKGGRELSDKAVDLLLQVGLEADHFYRYPHEFSGGQRQRIAIARALAVEPEFLVCDESVSSLDVSVQAQILNLLAELRAAKGLSYIFISHDLSVVRFIADRILVMRAGKIVEEGSSDDLYLDPKEDYTKKLIEAIPKTVENQ